MKLAIPMIAVCGALALAGCGGGESSTETGTGSTAAEAQSTAPEAESTGEAESIAPEAEASVPEPPTPASPPQLSLRGPEPKVPLPKGRPPKQLVVKNLKQGSGPAAKPGDDVTTQYAAVYVTGEPFESSWEPPEAPFTFTLGAEGTTPGLEKGLQGMKVGGRRQLIIPPGLTSYATPPGLPPELTQVYVIDLLAVNGKTAAN